MKKLERLGRILAWTLIVTLSGTIVWSFAPLVDTILFRDFAAPVVSYLRLVPILIPIGLLIFVFTRDRISTHASRRWGILLLLSVSFALMIAGPTTEKVAGVPLILAPAVYVFCLPARPLTLIPLVITLIALALIASQWIFLGAPLAFLSLLPAFMFPMHRRIIELWCPSKLPRLSKRSAQRGTTLIEQLIVVAILAIMAAGFAQIISVSAAAELRNRDHADALAAAEDEIALLRAAPALPADGAHKFDPRLTETNPAAARGEVIIEPGPAPSLRTVRVGVPVGDPVRGTVRLAVILPASTAPQNRGTK